jgi:2-polyprenyl-3-methyl-5-hydroxy-6-metoxy-1,4-benzoquinol methylase
MSTPTPTTPSPTGGAARSGITGLPVEFDQSAMMHRLPRARIVNRLDYLTEAARGKRVIHIGFADAGCAEMQDRHDTWLHARLARVAESLVGLDVDERGVRTAQEDGYEAFLVDCTNPVELAKLGLEPADLVIAGEVIEHVDNPGGFLEGVRSLLAPGGTAIVTTPNASGWFNSIAAVANIEINHPDHIVMFSWRTLSNLMARCGLEVVDAATFIPEVKDGAAEAVGQSADSRGEAAKARAMVWAARTVVAAERLVGRFAPFVADGLIILARPAQDR